jgi:hypothetical protein
MGGETRPEIQEIVFTPGYQVGYERQSFMLCVETTHTTYMYVKLLFAIER